MRLAPVVAASAVVLCSCASSVVTGHGAASSSSTSSTSSSQPPTSGSTLPPVGVGTVVTNTAGHYQVRMAGTANRTSQPGAFSGVTFKVYADAVTSPYVEIMASEDISVDLPANQYEVALKSAVSSFESSAGVTESSVTDTTFRGRQARQALVTRDGTQYTFLACVWAPNRLYLMFAPSGGVFDSFTNSFVPLP